MTSCTDLLLLDIETVPQVPNYNILTVEWQQLWWQKVQKSIPENTTPEESYRQRAGIMAEFGKIICISTAFFYYDADNQLQLKVKSIANDDEHTLLVNFVTLCNKFYQRNKQFQFAGHNIKEFDIPFIGRRLLINNIPLPPYFQIQDKKPWEVPMFDTMNWWKFGDVKNYTSLHLLATVMGVPTSKTDIDGSMVQEVYYEEQNLPRIVTYCEKDVIVVANLILRFLGQTILSPHQISIVS